MAVREKSVGLLEGDGAARGVVVMSRDVSRGEVSMIGCTVFGSDVGGVDDCDLGVGDLVFMLLLFVLLLLLLFLLLLLLLLLVVLLLLFNMSGGAKLTGGGCRLLLLGLVNGDVSFLGEGEEELPFVAPGLVVPASCRNLCE